jgi:hypothetical protein
VLQPEEWYKGKLIFHGLGNFVFSGMNYDEVHRIGGYLEVDVSAKGIAGAPLPPDPAGRRGARRGGWRTGPWIRRAWRTASPPNLR